MKNITFILFLMVSFTILPIYSVLPQKAPDTNTEAPSKAPPKPQKKKKPKVYILTVEKPFSGKITSTDGKISCGMSRCRAEYKEGETVTLTAIPDHKALQLSEWKEDCSEATPTCTLTMDSDKKVSANFSESETSPLEEKPDTAGKPCDPNIPHYSQPGCVEEEEEGEE